MGLLNETFGITGTAQTYFGGEWWLVGLMLILIFLLYFYGAGLSPEGIIIFIFSALLLVTIDQLFTIDNDIIMTIIIFILLFISLVTAKIFIK